MYRLKLFTFGVYRFSVYAATDDISTDNVSVRQDLETAVVVTERTADYRTAVQFAYVLCNS